MLRRDNNARHYLILRACRSGRGVDDVLERPEPPTILAQPFRVPREVLQRIVETFVPRNMSTPNYTRYDG